VEKMNGEFYLVENNEAIIILLIFLCFVVFIETISLIIIHKRYISFMKKLGNGNNVDELLKKYINEVREIKKDNEEIKNYYIKLDSDLASCVQKVGLVRYNAFKDVGSDLSFAIALLDGNNNGIVLNGIYGSESSNIYAKPIKGNKSSYQLSEEEEYAIEIAEQNKNFITKKRK
jgi:hypothetical protein